MIPAEWNPPAMSYLLRRRLNRRLAREITMTRTQSYSLVERITLLLLFLLLAAGPAGANQIAITWNGGTGNWSNAAQWTPAVVPNNAGGTTYSVTIDGTSAVTMDVLNATVDNLILATTGASLNVSAPNTFVGNTLTLNFGTSSNNGTLNISNPPGPLAPGMLINSSTLISSGTINNFGNLHITSGGTLANSGTLNNSGGLNASGHLSNLGNGTLNSFGGLDNFGTLDNWGTLNNLNSNISSGLKIHSGSTLTNWGTISNSTGINIANAGTLTNAGTLNNNSGGTVFIGGTLTNSGTISNSYGLVITNTGTLTNSGTLDNSHGGGLEIDSGGTLNNSGTLNINSGGFLAGEFYGPTGTLNNMAGGTFNFSGYYQTSRPGGAINNAGTFTNSGTIYIYDPAGTIINNSGTLVIAGVLEDWSTVQSTGTLNVASTGFLANSGNLTASQLSVGGMLTNNGILTMTIGNPLSVLAGGTLSGHGTVFGNVVNGGTLTSLYPTGIFTINGNYTQLSSGIYLVGLGGPFAGIGYNQLVVTGMATLGGTLDILLVDINALNHSGISFLILTAGDLQGTFSQINLQGCSYSCTAQLAYGPNSVFLTVTQQTPEPASLVFVGTGLLSLFLGVRRRRLVQQK
jgi:hypothetical protein